MQIISGKELSAKLKAEMAKDVATYKEKYGRLPKLSVILVGEDPGSVSYVTGKAKACEEVGILNETIRRGSVRRECAAQNSRTQCRQFGRRNIGSVAVAKTHRRGQSNFGYPQRERCRRFPSAQRSGSLEQYSVCSAVYAQRSDKTTEKPKYRDKRKKRSGNRTQQYSGIACKQTASE